MLMWDSPIGFGALVIQGLPVTTEQWPPGLTPVSVTELRLWSPKGRYDKTRSQHHLPVLWVDQHPATSRYDIAILCRVKTADTPFVMTKYSLAILSENFRDRLSQPASQFLRQCRQRAETIISATSLAYGGFTRTHKARDDDITLGSQTATPHCPLADRPAAPDGSRSKRGFISSILSPPSFSINSASQHQRHHRFTHRDRTWQGAKIAALVSCHFSLACRQID